ncbi:glycosyltransferase [Marinilabilia rubra]|uniref:Glycosyl transferase family 1 n=1 Tax=Marinilabilia rubra TaxID=2162893 RepID=A0A2U2B3X2_9BACT|nr:glycosyltransferase [Marinilabilia rubra]PWD97760.1 glycosyl transferase family 1 [Marinilabilia rubra]
MNNYTLCLYTAQFPYGLGEQFIETEITYLAQAFERVVIIPAAAEGTPRPLPANVEVRMIDYSGYSTVKGLRYVGFWIRHCINDVRRSTNKRLAISTLLRVGYQASVLHSFLKSNQLLGKALHYTYWFNEQSTLLAIIKEKKMIDRFISRAHGFDLYEERNFFGYIPFRKLQLHYVSKLYLIAADGLDYMQEKYPAYKNKYEVSHLGVEQKHPFEAKVNHSDTYTLVSCSRMVDIKRVYLIVEALAQIKNIPIHWVHFGNGPLFAEIKRLSQKLLPLSIEAELKGHVDNIEIFNYYRNCQPDCFINVSSTEGLPVSIMEALSFGIPVVATNVGGTSEIVNNLTGKLIPSDSSGTFIANAIINIFKTHSRSSKQRSKIRDFWHQNFNARNNYSTFTSIISNEKTL